MNDKSKNKSELEKHGEPNKKKKTYRAPHLEVYGSLASLTNGNGGPYSDGSSGNSSMKNNLPAP